MVSFGETKLGKIGETISEKSGLKRRFLGKKRDFKAVFQNSDLPLTPSFVGSNPATPASYTIYCIRNMFPNTIYGFLFYQRLFSPF